ncbi:hypothetical protein MNBD_ACTINO02-2871, partial [hydrothermal vent metagenome]
DMHSWRDSASQQTQDDLDELLNAALPAAAFLLQESGEFFPFGVEVLTDGTVRHVAANPGTGEQPDSLAVLEMLADGFRSNRDNIRAAAFVANVSYDGSDAVQVESEHSEGQAIVLLAPFRRTRFSRRITFGEFVVGTSDPRVWTAG